MAGKLDLAEVRKALEKLRADPRYKADLETTYDAEGRPIYRVLETVTTEDNRDDIVELRPEYRREDLGPGVRGKYLETEKAVDEVPLVKAKKIRAEKALKEKKLLTTEELFEYLDGKVSRSWFEHHRKDGKGPKPTYIGRRPFYRPTVVDAWLLRLEEEILNPPKRGRGRPRKNPAR